MFVEMLDSPCARRVLNGIVFGGAMGASIGALYGTFEAFRYKVPGIYKIRHIGQTTLSATAMCGLLLGAGSLLHCGKN